MPYVDGFVLAVPKARLDRYQAFTREAGEVLKEHGACAYVECVGDALPEGEQTAIPHAVQSGEDEVVVYAWIVYSSKDERDEVHAKVMADPRLADAPAGFTLGGKRLIEAGLHAQVEI